MRGAANTHLTCFGSLLQEAHCAARESCLGKLNVVGALGACALLACG
jgi:hypothetical protein